MESNPENLQFISFNSNEEHLNLIENNNVQHLVISLVKNEIIGFAILSGVKDPKKCIEFRRLVIKEKCKDYGRKAIVEIKRLCFEQLKCHRLWLDVLESNLRARNLYKTVATGFLAKFVDGFSSPPHIYNVTYRAVVIKGLVHNDDPKAENMWMPPCSFWTQPAGESHITSAKGDEIIAYVEIDSGPYLVKPIKEAFEVGEQPKNISAANVFSLNNKTTNWIDSNCNAELSFFWKDENKNEMSGLFVKLPPGFEGKIESDGNVLHAVIAKGILNYKMPQTNTIKVLDAGSYFSSSNKAIHSVSNNSVDEIVIYMRTNVKVILRN